MWIEAVGLLVEQFAFLWPSAKIVRKKSVPSFLVELRATVRKSDPACRAMMGLGLFGSL